MNTTIIIDERYRDTAASQVASILSGRGEAKVVTLAQFLTQAGVTFDQENGNLSWDKSLFYKRFPDARSRRICNRVISISSATVAALDHGEEVLTPNMAFQAYANILYEFSQVWGEPGMYSPAGNLLPLNLQWRLFGSHISHIATPKFAYGFGFTSIDTHDFRQPLWKSPFDLYGWKAEEVDKDKIHPFVVDKPTGKAVFLYFIGNATEAFTLGPQSDIDQATRSTLLQSAEKIRQMFGAFMGEALFFVDGAQLTFAAFSHYLKTSLSDAHFSAVLANGLAESDA